MSFALCLGLFAVNAVPLAQQPSPPAQPSERGVDLIAIDFTAISADGRPVADLQAADVSVRIGGRRRPVRSLQLISVAGSEPVPEKASLPSPFATNDSSERGRDFALLIDDDSFKAGREGPLREAVDGLIARLSSRDRLTLVTMPYGGVKVPLTSDHARVRTALLKVVGQATGHENGSQLACRTRRTLESLAGYFDGSHGIREAPLTVMFITGGLAAPRRDAPVTMAPGMCELRTETFREVGIAAGAARAQFYVIQPGDMMLVPARPQTENIAGSGYIGSDNPIEGIEHLVGVTGGTMLQLTGTVDGAMGRILAESSGYYLAAVEPDGNDRTGRSQQLEIRVSRPGVTLRARPNVTFARRESIDRRPLNPSPRDMLSVATVFRNLPLRASAYSALEVDGKSLRVITIVEPVEPTVKFGSLVAALFDRDGKLVSHWTATADELQRAPVIGAMPATQGAYRLRVAAIDTTGRSGTTDYDLEAEIVQTGPLRLSSLILGLSREGRFTPRLVFGSEPVAIAYVEMYGVAPGTRLAAGVELAGSLNGPALVTLPMAIEAAGEARYTATGAVPIGSLPPGDYVVRAMIGIDGQAITRVVRTLRKAGGK